jgi:hypothetical protein
MCVGVGEILGPSGFVGLEKQPVRAKAKKANKTIINFFMVSPPILIQDF